MSRLPFMIATAAAVIALGFFAFVTDAPAYGGSAPETCANCHVMDSQYENWYTGTDACSAVHKRYVTAANRNIL